MNHPLLPITSSPQAAFIRQSILKTVGNLAEKTFAELTEGEVNISFRLRHEVRSLVVNHVTYRRYVLNRHYLGNHKPFDYQEWLTELNGLPGVSGLISKKYCPGSGNQHPYFSDENGRQIDAIRQRVEQWKEQNFIHEGAYYFLLTSLLKSAQRVANVSTADSLPPKTFKKSARQPLLLKDAPFEPYPEGKKPDVHFYRENISDLVGRLQGDVLYLDLLGQPLIQHPYTQLLEDLALYDAFDTREKMHPPVESELAFQHTDKLQRAFEDCINRADFAYVFVRSNDESLVPVLQVKEVMARYGDYNALAEEFPGRSKHPTTELLHILKKEKYAIRHQFGQGR